MITHGTVIEKNGSVSKVKIGGDACQGCGKCGKFRQKVITAHDTTNALIGDSVTLEVDDSKYKLSILLLYILPLIALIIGVFVGFYIISPLIDNISVDIISVGCGIIFTVIVYLILRVFRNKFDSKLAAYVISVEQYML